VKRTGRSSRRSRLSWHSVHLSQHLAEPASGGRGAGRRPALDVLGDQDGSTSKRGDWLRVSTALGWDATPLKMAKHLRVALGALERPAREEQARHPRRTVRPLDPKDARIEAGRRGDSDPVAILQM
jgi:hypothetical protein